MYSLKSLDKNFICISKSEYEVLFRQKAFILLDAALKKRGLSLNDLSDDKQKMIEFSGAISDMLQINNDETELFVAFYIYLKYYDDAGKICLEIKNSINLNKYKINTIEDLLSILEKKTPIDFGIISQGEIRLFQLKRYREKIDTVELLTFIKKKMHHYGNKLGHINLLITLQTGGDISDVNFEELHDSLVKLNLQNEGQILISYNENNKLFVMNQIYPDLTTTRIPAPIHYPELIDDYQKRKETKIGEVKT
ncbi:MAG: hypothetical protein WC575_02705 [Patescibacteria group bacterium]